MRAATCLLAIAIAAGVPATAMAQSTTTTAPAPTYSGQSTGQWFASGFVGSNFSASLDTNLENTNLDNNSSNSSLEFGGNVGYTWNRVFGVEFLADFTPTFGVSRILNADEVNRLIDDPRVNTYMFNAIAAVPISAGRFQPFISGGIGGVSVVADVLDNVLLRDGSTTRSSLSRMGTNLGGGVYTFAGNIGFRADVRHYHSSADDNRTATIVADQLTENLVSGLSFWRANVGLAFRW
jgi:outer membrane protein with beta-barrel domain